MKVYEANSLIFDRYQIIEVIIEHSSQVIYLATEIDTGRQVIINQVNKNFYFPINNTDSSVTGILDIRNSDGVTFLVSTLAEGPTLKEYVDENNPTLKERIDISLRILDTFRTLPEEMPVDIRSRIVNVNNIVLARDNTRFNYILLAGDDDMDERNETDVMRNIGTMLYFLFSGNEYSLDSDDSELPPDIAKIINQIFTQPHAMSSAYDVANAIKATSLYNLFYSTDDSIYEDTSYNGSNDDLDFKPTRDYSNIIKIAVLGLLVVALIFGGVFAFKNWFSKDPTDPTDPSNGGNGKDPTPTENIKPVALFEENLHEIREGDRVVFTSTSYDPDITDSIAGFHWMLIKDTTVVAEGDEQTFSHTFVSKGTYRLSLRVMDSRSLWSDTYTKEITVLERASGVDITDSLKYTQNFESSTLPSGWSGVNSSGFEQDTFFSYRGNGSLKVTSNLGVVEFGSRATFDLKSSTFGVYKGQNAVAVAWVRSNESSTAQIKVVFYDSRGGIISSSTSSNTQIGQGWNMLRHNFRVPTNTERMEILVLAKGSGVIWIDDFELNMVK